MTALYRLKTLKTNQLFTLEHSCTSSLDRFRSKCGHTWRV